MHIRQPALDAVMVEAEPLVIKAEDMKDAGVEIVNRRNVLHRL
jgi:hypothetical protein